MKLKSLILLIIVASLASCSSSKFITSEKTYPKLNLDFRSNRLTFVDERPTVSTEKDIHLPVVSFAGQRYSFYPKMTETYENIIAQSIIENTAQNSSKILVTKIYILEAKKEFSATFTTEKELVVLKFKFVFNVDGKETELVEVGEFYRNSADANYKKFEKLFQKSLKELTYNALKKIGS